MFQRSLFCLAAVLGLSAMLSPALARAQGEIAVTKFDQSGTITSISPGRIYMDTADGKRWEVQITTLFATGKTVVDVQGTVSSKRLTPGQYVRFTAMIDTKTGTAQGFVKKLALFKPDDVFKPGLFPNETTDDSERVRSYLVAGGLRSIRSGRIVVLTPQGSITARIAADVEVTFRSADYRAAKRGDAIHVEGGYEKVGVVIAQKINIRRGGPPAAVPPKTDENPPVKKPPATEPSQKKPVQEDAAPQAKEEGPLTLIVN